MKTVAIIGLGARGAETYGTYLAARRDRATVTAICDPDAEKRAKYGDLWGVPQSHRFATAQALFACGKTADILIIASTDRAHYEQATTALAQGYDLLLEKPISPDEEECLAIGRAAKKFGRKVVVCHVMRYTAYYQKLKQLLDDGTVGDVIAIDQEENVSWWHQAHAFVRGNFGVSTETSPMILQKCCHDMDLLRWLVGSPPVAVSSTGKLNYFTAAHAPKGSSDRCVDCAYRGRCAFDAVKFYIEDGFRTLPDEKKTTTWPYNMLCVDPTEERLLHALKEGKYGRCVFRCNNDVVDFQQATVRFASGATGHLTMTGFTYDGGRRTKVMGTKGEILLDELRGELSVGVFGREKQLIRFTDLTDDFSGHGGGDVRMMDEFLEMAEGKIGDASTDVLQSIDSHLMCFAAEKSRAKGGAYQVIETV